MIKFLIAIISIVYSVNSFGQTNYDRGFQVGYSKGYCYDMGVGCISPNPPNPPNPKIGENPDSYQDGYNRGFELGRSQQSSMKTRKRNITSSDEQVDYMYRPDANRMQSALEAVDNKITENKKFREALMDWIYELKKAPTDKEFAAAVDKL